MIDCITGKFIIYMIEWFQHGNITLKKTSLHVSTDEWKIAIEGTSGGVRYIVIAYDEESFLRTTIKRVKQMVLESSRKSTLDTEQIRLLFAGKQLENTRGSREMTIRDYGIKKGSTLQEFARVQSVQRTGKSVANKLYKCMCSYELRT